MAGELDVALDEFALPLPAQEQDEVVRSTAAKEKDADEHGAQARPIPAVVVLGAFPGRKPIAQEVVVAVAAGSAQDVDDDGQARLSLSCPLDRNLDLGGRGRLRDLDGRLRSLLLLFLGLLLLRLGSLGRELLLDLVRVQRPRAFLVCLVDVLEADRRRGTEEFVKGDIGSFVGNELVADAEDLAVYASWLATLALSHHQGRQRSPLLGDLKNELSKVHETYPLSTKRPLMALKGLGARRWPSRFS